MVHPGGQYDNPRGTPAHTGSRPWGGRKGEALGSRPDKRRDIHPCPQPWKARKGPETLAPAPSRPSRSAPSPTRRHKGRGLTPRREEEERPAPRGRGGTQARPTPPPVPHISLLRAKYSLSAPCPLVGVFPIFRIILWIWGFPFPGCQPLLLSWPPRGRLNHHTRWVSSSPSSDGL